MVGAADARRLRPAGPGRYNAHAEFQLDDGRRVSASISKYSNHPSEGWRPSLFLYISPGQYCYPVACGTGATGYASVPLTDDQVTFERGLRRYALSETAVTLQSRGGWGEPVIEEKVSISLVFAGTGPVDRWAEHGKVCGDGERECESTRNYANRDAVATLTLDGVVHSTTAPDAMWYAHYVDAAVPEFEYPPGY